jgi:hypothetical protein
VLFSVNEGKIQAPEALLLPLKPSDGPINGSINKALTEILIYDVRSITHHPD